MFLLSIASSSVIPGHCTRGDKCWFRHDLPKVAADDERIQFSAETCCICLEKPKTYGLLSEQHPQHGRRSSSTKSFTADCSHVFCLEVNPIILNCLLMILIV